MTSKPTTKNLPLQLIDPDPNNGRANMDADSLAELAASIEKNGLTHPIGVNKSDAAGRFDLIFGHRRFAAAKLVKIATLPARVYRGLSAEEIQDLRLAENLQREDLSPMDEAREISKMKTERNLALADIAARLDRSVAWVYARLDLLRLEHDIQILVGVGRLPATYAAVIARLADGVEQIGAAAFAIGLRESWRDVKPNGLYLAKLLGKKPKQYDVVQWGAETDMLVPLPDLRREVGSTLRKTSKLWPLDVEYAGEKPCVGCIDHSTTNPGLFAGIVAADDDAAAGGKCADAHCYKTKLALFEKEKDARRKARLKAAAKKAKDQAARKKANATGVCTRCGKVRKDGETWPGRKTCPRCKKTLAKEAEKVEEREQRQRASGQIYYNSPSIKKLRAAFPSTPAEQLAVGLWKHLETVCGLLNKRLSSSRPQPLDVLSLLVLVRFRCTWPIDNWGAVGGTYTPATLAGVLKNGKRAGIGPKWIADSFKATFACVVQRHAPCFGKYNIEPENVPLPSTHMGFLDLVEQLGKRWGITIPARPVASVAGKVPPAKKKTAAKKPPKKKSPKKLKTAKK